MDFTQSQVRCASVAAAVAVPFARLMGNVLGGYYLGKSAVLAMEDLIGRGGDKHFLSENHDHAFFSRTCLAPFAAPWR